MASEKDFKILRNYVKELLDAVSSEKLRQLPSILAGLTEENELQYSTKFKVRSRYAWMKDHIKAIIITAMLPLTAAILTLFPESLKEGGLQVYVTFILLLAVFLLPIPFIYAKIKNVYLRTPSESVFWYAISARKELDQLVQQLANVHEKAR